MLKEMVNFIKDAKSIFGSTFIFRNGVVSFAPEESKLKGLHLGLTDYSFFTVPIPLRVYGANIYRVDKNIKKNIKGFNVNSDCEISFDIDGVKPDDMIITENKQQVRMSNNIAEPTTITDAINLSVYRALSDWDSSDAVKLSSDEVEDLVKNKTYLASGQGINTRITRSLIPGLKKTHDVEIMYTDNFEEVFGKKNDGSPLYVLWIRVKRETMTSIHAWAVYDMWAQL